MRRCHLRNMRTAAIHPSDKKGEAFPFDGSVSLFSFLFFDYFITDIIQRLEYHTGAGHTVISLADYGIFDQVVILPDLSPHTEHIFLLSDCIRRSGQISLMIPGFLFVKFLNSYEYKGFWLFCYIRL